MGGVKKQYSQRSLESDKNGPKKIIDWDQVDQMIVSGGNGVQVAAALGMHPETLYLRCEKEKGVGFSVYHQEKRSKGDLLLHSAQYSKALKDKNPTMLIWLGKQRLGQTENKDDVIINPENLAKFNTFIAAITESQADRSIDTTKDNTEDKS